MFQRVVRIGENKKSRISSACNINFLSKDINLSLIFHVVISHTNIYTQCISLCFNPGCKSAIKASAISLYSSE